MSLDGYNLGNAYGRVIISDNIDQAMSQAQRSFDRGIRGVGQSMQRFGDSLTGMGARITALTAPITAFGVSGVSAASRFEDALTEISVRAGLTEDQLEAVRQKALDIGRDSQFSAGQGAEAFLQLLTSGQSVEEAFQTIDHVIMGAQASGEDLGFTSDALTDIMAAMGLEVDQAGRVIQTLTDASGASSASFADLVAGFQNSASVAFQAGMSVEELAATLAVLSENGIKGSNAGTALRSTLNAIQRETPAVVNKLGELGVSLFDNEGQARSLADITNDLSAAMAGMTDEERVEAFNRLADTFARQGLGALTAGDGIDEMMAMMSEGTDVADIAASRMDTFSGSVAFLRGSIETLQIKALTPLIEDTLRPMVMQIGEVVNRVSAWVDENPDLTKTIVKITAGVLVLGPALVGLGVAISTVGSAISGLGLAIKVLTTGPVGLLLAAIGAVVYAFSNDLGGIRTFVFNFLDDLNFSFDGVAETLRQTVLPVLERLRAWFVEDALPAIASFVDGHVMPVIRGFVDFLANAWAVVQPALMMIADWFIGSMMPAAKSFLENGLLPAVRSVVNFLAGMWEVVGPALGSFATWFLEDALPEILNFISETVMPIVEGFFGFLAGLWDFVGPALIDLTDWFLTTGIPAIVWVLEHSIIPMLNLLVDILKFIWTIVEPPLNAFVNGVAALFGWLGENVIQPIIDFIEGIVGAVGDAVEAIESLGNLDRSGEGHGGMFGTGVGPDFDPIGGIRDLFDEGGYAAPNSIAHVGSGQMGREAFIVGDQGGTFYPDFARNLAEIAAGVVASRQAGPVGGSPAESGLSGGGDVYNVTFEIPPELLRDNATAASAGETLAQQFAESMRRRG